ncbi:MAG: periplasmic heavy metal sensor [Mailhella sp.]|nr:periplasmic heavy metal sensor [Mailhella sp.]
MNAKIIISAALSAAVLFAAPVLAAGDQAPAANSGQAAEQKDARIADAKAKHEQFLALMKEYRGAVQPIQDKLWQKHTELRYLSVNPNVQPDDLRAIIAEISELRKQMRGAREGLLAKQKEAGLPPIPPEAFRSGPHMPGDGSGQGPRGPFFPPRPDDKMRPGGPHDGPKAGGAPGQPPRGPFFPPRPDGMMRPGGPHDGPIPAHQHPCGRMGKPAPHDGPMAGARQPMPRRGCGCAERGQCQTPPAQAPAESAD